MSWLRATASISAGFFAALSFGQGPISIRSYASGLDRAIATIQDPLNAGTQFVVQQNGRIRTVTNGVLGADLINLSGSVSFSPSSEGGLLGLAFAPDHASATTKYLYAYFTDLSGNIQVARYTRVGAAADPLSRLDIINVPHPFNSNHNGATPLFGPDGMLYLGIGDGGAGNDPPNNAQNPNQLLGKMLRIDPSGDDFPGDPTRNYRIPTNNPFFGPDSLGARDEIWAFGYRNPYKFTFDRANGAMVVGDVGQNAWEEIDYEPAGRSGRNYGWVVREGAHVNPNAPAGATLAYGPPTDPIFEYNRSVGQSITGGVVYRGTLLGSYFQGRYFFADWSQRRVWSLGLNVDPTTGEATAGNLLEHTAAFGGGAFFGNITSFDIGTDGELYMTSFNGTVYQIVPEPTTWLALVAGAGALAARRRRRSRQNR